MTAADDPITWLNLGVLGLVLVALFSNKLALGREVTQRQERIDKLEDELASLRQRLDERLLPLFVRATDMLARLAELERPDHPQRNNPGSWWSQGGQSGGQR